MATLDGKTTTIPLVKESETGVEMYTFEKPVFTQNMRYLFKVSAFEQYKYYELDEDNLPVVKMNGNAEVVDRVPTVDGEVSVQNRIRDGAIAPDTFPLDSTGVGFYSFVAGDPDDLSTGTADLSLKVSFGNGTGIDWEWEGKPKLNAFLIGGKLVGKDFVTAGPNQIMMVLRDPPGSKSYSYAERGSVLTTTKTYSGAINQSSGGDVILKVGPTITTSIGFGASVVTEVKVGNQIGLTLEQEASYTRSNTTEETVTLNTRFQTSDDPLFAGPIADVFVGYSTNIVYGGSNNIAIVKENESLQDDDILFETPDYKVIRRDGIAIGEKFGTLFACPQQHIEKVLIPNLIKIRNSLLLPLGTDPRYAQTEADKKKELVYVSKLPNGSPNFGKSNRDTVAFGPQAKATPTGDGDSYKICESRVRS